MSAAAGAWDVPRVRLLLELGAGGLLTGPGSPEPLYRAANAVAPGREDEGRAVVALLLEHGADVNGQSHVGRMTPLHMAARRGTVAIAEALLAAGADVEARDAKGETPLRRAVNIGQEAWPPAAPAGADPLSRDTQRPHSARRRPARADPRSAPGRRPTGGEGNDSGIGWQRPRQAAQKRLKARRYRASFLPLSVLRPVTGPKGRYRRQGVDRA